MHCRDGQCEQRLEVVVAPGHGQPPHLRGDEAPFYLWGDTYACIFQVVFRVVYRIAETRRNAGRSVVQSARPFETAWGFPSRSWWVAHGYFSSRCSRDWLVSEGTHASLQLTWPARAGRCSSY